MRTAKEISIDQTNQSVSFNEFLTLNGKYKTTTNPSEQLLECFEMFDTEKTGTIPETVFRRIMTRKNGQIHQDFDEMLAAYKQVHCKSNPETPQGEEYIDYKESRRSFQNKADFFCLLLLYWPASQVVRLIIIIDDLNLRSLLTCSKIEFEINNTTDRKTLA